MTVAKTILDQLGGGRLVAMTGAKGFIGSENALSFKIGRNAKAVNAVRVVLEPSDTYTVQFFGRMGKLKAEVSDVYVENLCKVFETNTGMYLKLF